MAAGCECSFMRKADLVSHVQNHSGTVHKCNQCEYSAMDIRYLKQHQREHSNDLESNATSATEALDTTPT